MAKLLCLKTFNEQGMFIVPGERAFGDSLADYLLSNYPAYFTVATPAPPVDNAAQSRNPTTPTEEPVEVPPPGVTSVDAPPADKMVRRARKKK